ncbi:unnamed protein product [Heligmosomoides polygyrus]|uniref:DUF4238 domain-containing protein n=1 Tax=Heligmosomoides polygyrus TaxID=6339 RepID=A0A183F9F9_HELPZ|nr:unnamed protein product [Heligmosomoides polygyrus]
MDQSSMIELDSHAYKIYSDYVLPQEPRHIDLVATVDKLTKLLGPKQTLIRRRFELLQLTGRAADYVTRLTDPSHSDVRLRLLNRLICLKEDDASPSLDDFVNTAKPSSPSDPTIARWNPKSHAAVPVKTADGSPMYITGLFKANFPIFDRHQRVTTGQGNCYVTEATDLLGLEWCVEMEQYRQLKEQFHCRLATAALNDIRNETVAFIKRGFPAWPWTLHKGKSKAIS